NMHELLWTRWYLVVGRLGGRVVGSWPQRATVRLYSGCLGNSGCRLAAMMSSMVVVLGLLRHGGSAVRRGCVGLGYRLRPGVGGLPSCCHRQCCGLVGGADIGRG